MSIVKESWKVALTVSWAKAWSIFHIFNTCGFYYQICLKTLTSTVFLIFEVLCYLSTCHQLLLSTIIDAVVSYAYFSIFDRWHSNRGYSFIPKQNYLGNNNPMHSRSDGFVTCNWLRTLIICQRPILLGCCRVDLQNEFIKSSSIGLHRLHDVSAHSESNRRSKILL